MHGQPCTSNIKARIHIHHHCNTAATQMTSQELNLVSHTLAVERPRTTWDTLGLQSPASYHKQKLSNVHAQAFAAKACWTISRIRCFSTLIMLCFALSKSSSDNTRFSSSAFMIASNDASISRVVSCGGCKFNM